MHVRAFTLAFLALFLPSPGPGEATVPAHAPATVVVRNDTYSSLHVSLVDETGREVSLGLAPPEFSNTLVVEEPLPAGPVRLLARLSREEAVLYRSDTIRLRSGVQVRWRLPENRLEP